MAFKQLRKVKLTSGMYRNMPFLAFLAALGMVYIANAHHGEKVMREIEALEKEATETHWRYMSVESMLTQKGRRSEVEAGVMDEGLRMPVESPKKLIVDN
jgi:hypothetical protein